MPEPTYFIVPLVTLLAFFIKGATGFGTALVMVPTLTVVLGVRTAIVVSSILDTVAGTILFYRDPLHDSRRFWLPMAGGMVVGSIIGGIVLKIMPVDGFTIFLGIVVALLGFWFMFGRNGKNNASLPETPPETATSGDIGVSTFSGFCGGLFGISGPPIVYWLGTRLAKSAFRSTLVAVFLFGGIARLSTYTLTGLMDSHCLVLSVVALPGLLLGLFLGNHLFVRISERWFSRLIGVILVASSLRLLL